MSGWPAGRPLSYAGPSGHRGSLLSRQHHELAQQRVGVGAVGLAVRGLSLRLEGLVFSGPSTHSLVVPQEFSSELFRAAPFAKEQILLTSAMCVLRSIQ